MDLTLTVTHHDFQELDDDFGTRSNEDLAFTSLFGIVN